jgi:ubiquinone/menaquinone biosynthesis C-methylase UbiE
MLVFIVLRTIISMDDIEGEMYRRYRAELHERFTSLSVDEYVEQQRQELREAGGLEASKWFLSTWETFDNGLDILYDEHTARYGSLVRDTIKSYEDKTLLDIGCGRETTFPYLAGEKNTVIQIDVRDDLMLLSYDLPPETESRIVRGSAFQLPVIDESADVIIAEAGFGAFNSSKNPSWLRTLKPGGDVLHLFTAHAPHLFSVQDALTENGIDQFSGHFENIRYREGEGSILFTGYHTPENV